jgi:hypothetical protein
MGLFMSVVYLSVVGSCGATPMSSYAPTVGSYVAVTNFPLLVLVWKR